jgi:hypothetical protein
MELHDPHFCLMALLSATEWRSIGNKPAMDLARACASAGMIELDGIKGRLLPDGVSALNDYRALGADV